MKCAWAAIVVFSCAVSVQGEPPPVDVESRIAAVESGLSPAVRVEGYDNETWSIDERLAHYRVPGVSVAVINDGRIEWARGYGVVEAGGDRAVTVGTMFQAASISKPVAAMGALALVDDEALSLDTDVNETLASWQLPGNGFTGEHPVTLRRLLSHTAGLTVHGFRGYAEGEPVPTTVQVLNGATPANSAAIEVNTPPGATWRYSGGGYTVMQQMVADVTGEAFEVVMSRLVLSRIGMVDSTYEQPLSTSRLESTATGHGSNGQPIPGRRHTYPEQAAAGLWTTPSDLARFALELREAAADRSNRVLSTETAGAMLDPGLGGWGLGLSIEAGDGWTKFSHGGSNQGFKCTMIAFTEPGIGAVVMTNGDGGRALAAEIIRSIAIAYDWPTDQPQVRHAVEVDASVLTGYVGEFQLVENPRITLKVAVRDGVLTVTRSNTPNRHFRLYPESQTSFFATENTAEISFVRNEDGAVNEIVITGVAPAPLKAKRIGE